MSERPPSTWVDDLLFILALPILTMRGIGALNRERKRFRVIRNGIVTCPSPTCRTINTLTRMNRCPNCGHVAPSSVLYCDVCRETYDWVACEGCGRTLKVL